MLSKRSSLFTVLAMLLVLSLTLGACQPAATEAPAEQPTQAPAVQATQAPTEAPTQAPAEEKVFKLGVLGPFTGPSAQVGDEFKQSTKMALDAINYKIGDYK